MPPPLPQPLFTLQPWLGAQTTRPIAPMMAAFTPLHSLQLLEILQPPLRTETPMLFPSLLPTQAHFSPTPRLLWPRGVLQPPFWTVTLTLLAYHLLLPMQHPVGVLRPPLSAETPTLVAPPLPMLATIMPVPPPYPLG